MGKASKDHHVSFKNNIMGIEEEQFASLSLSSSSSSSSFSSSRGGGDDSSSFSASSSVSTSSDMADDASSPFISSSSSPNNISDQSLYDLSDIMAQLPIKRGLSKYYDGKSQSYTSLSKVTSLEDLMKKSCPHGIRKPMKGSKSYGGGLDSFKSHTLPKPTISKRSPRNRLSSSSFSHKKVINNCKPPLAPLVQKTLRC